jgi:hypothetical protein
MTLSPHEPHCSAFRTSSSCGFMCAATRYETIQEPAIQEAIGRTAVDECCQTLLPLCSSQRPPEGPKRGGWFMLCSSFQCAGLGHMPTHHVYTCLSGCKCGRLYSRWWHVCTVIRDTDYLVGEMLTWIESKVSKDGFEHLFGGPAAGVLIFHNQKLVDVNRCEPRVLLRWVYQAVLVHWNLHCLAWHCEVCHKAICYEVCQFRCLLTAVLVVVVQKHVVNSNVPESAMREHLGDNCQVDNHEEAKENVDAQLQAKTAQSHFRCVLYIYSYTFRCVDGWLVAPLRWPAGCMQLTTRADLSGSTKCEQATRG